LARLDLKRDHDRRTAFKAALVYELTGDRTRALSALERAMRAGYSSHEITNEPELAKLRSDPRYAEIVTSLAAPKQK
jgi:hypothetical protein